MVNPTQQKIATIQDIDKPKYGTRRVTVEGQQSIQSGYKKFTYFYFDADGVKVQCSETYSDFFDLQIVYIAI